MRFAGSVGAILALLAAAETAAGGSLREQVLRDQAIKAGLVPVEEVMPSFRQALSGAGRLLFASKELSLTREISCQSCHLDSFGSSDGIPVGVGTRGQGEGLDRLQHGGDFLPRRTSPLWGRGALGFDTFFWDGQVDGSGNSVMSAFGDAAPSSDPLVVVAHLPPVEIREMVRDDEDAEALRTETVDSARKVYAIIEERVRSDDALSAALTRAYGFDREDIRYIHVAESIASFIRDRFRLQPTKFHDFVFRDGDLNKQELAGGILFYGRGRCAACHNGPFFSDLSFHAIPFGQLGRGKNGFGIDYGRYNVTRDPADLYKFRTPPLYKVIKTAPYAHSGAAIDLAGAIRAHVDPLGAAQVGGMSAAERAEFYRRLGSWAGEPIFGVELDDQDIRDLAAFVSALAFPDLQAAPITNATSRTE